MGSGKGNKALIRWYVGRVPCLGFRLKSNLHLLDPHLLPPSPFPPFQTQCLSFSGLGDSRTVLLEFMDGIK